VDRKTCLSRYHPTGGGPDRPGDSFRPTGTRSGTGFASGVARGSSARVSFGFPVFVRSGRIVG